MIRQSLTKAKWAFSTRRVCQNDAKGLSTDFETARAGDLVLGRVTTISSHRRIQMTSGRPSQLYPDDLIVLACGARYAADQFEGYAEISSKGADMLAGGGCLGRMVFRNSTVKPPTRVQPLGLLTNADGLPLNLSDYALPEVTAKAQIPVICVVGAGMNAGKTTATAALIYGLRRAGYTVAGLKGTGTGAFGDFNAYTDAGATYVGDFTDVGMVSTYREPMGRITEGIARLIVEAETQGCDVAVLEIADGVLQRETAALLADPTVRGRMSGFVYACGDPLSAAGGVSVLRSHGIRPDVLTGMLSCSPMASAEAEAATGIAVMTKADLSDPAGASGIMNAMAIPMIGQDAA